MDLFLLALGGLLGSNQSSTPEMLTRVSRYLSPARVDRLDLALEVLVVVLLLEKGLLLGHELGD